MAAASADFRPDQDREPIRRACEGDRAAFAVLVERYWERLHRWLFHLCRDRHAAEDLAQETFLKAFANLPRFRPEGRFDAWLFRIAHNNFANYCRSRPRREPLPEELPDPADSPEEQALRREALSDLGEALERLPTDYRAALLLRAEQDLSFREIGQVLGLTEETARWRVFKARRLLMNLLTPRQQGTP